MSMAAEDRSTELDKVNGQSTMPVASVPTQRQEIPDEHSAEESPVGADTGRATRPRRRRIWMATALAFLIVAVFAGAATGYSLLQPKIYGAQAEFILTARPELSDAAVDRAMVTQAMVVRSDPVLGPVATQVGMSLPDLRGEVSADIVGRSDILRVTVGDRDQARAVRLVQLITAEYLRTPTRAPTPGTGTTTDDRAPLIVPTMLSAASPLESPLQPRPVRALAAGIILGLLVATAVVVVVLRPSVLTLPSPRWE
jgi:capsular polysaccharide biosynthesis protein